MQTKTKLKLYLWWTKLTKKLMHIAKDNSGFANTPNQQNKIAEAMLNSRNTI